MQIVGIDPGLSGAIAVITDTAEAPLVDIYDMPTIATKTAKGSTKLIYDLNRLREILACLDDHAQVYVEIVHAMPKQGVSSMFSLGYGLGVLHGILSAFKISYQGVHPRTWTGAYSADSDKGKHYLIAGRLYPDADLRTKSCGRADALLIADYGRRQHTS